ncbi:MAG: HAMP domain-containing histidine kinase [Proteobacteria bacterium]|nr:HAMP domain-containing histidine kinase [Pseudomonadota bacterium]
MQSKRLRIVYWVLVPAIAIAAAVLCYYTYQTALQVERLGEESIAQSTLFLVQDKVDRVERQIIAADNAVFRSIELGSPDALDRSWRPRAREISPSVRAVLVLDATYGIVGSSVRVPGSEAPTLLRRIRDRIVPALDLDQLVVGRLKHLHKSYQDGSLLVSYKAVLFRAARYYLLAEHDTAYLKRTLFPSLFANEKGKQLYNVLDEDNRRVFGPSLAHAGDYVVGLRFPTTLYGWRLQIAPKAAPLLQAKGRTRRFNEVALIGLSLGVIVLSVLFLLYTAGKEQRLGALKSDFIANVSHELKTPLAAVRMFGELLLTNRVRDSAKRQQYLEIICTETERLTALIDNVLDFSALERGKRRYQMQVCNLADLIRRAIETFRNRMERGAQDIALACRGHVPYVRVDEEAILLAFINLLDNAVKYGERGDVEVAIESQGASVAVRVRDHGQGIPRDELRRVFDRFYRSRREPSVRGSGIGLSLVKHIIQDHGGQAWAENAPDGGAIVSFDLPQVLGPASRPATTPGVTGVRTRERPAGEIHA